MRRGAVLTLDGVHVGYGDRIVLEGASLTIQRGEIHCLLGANGAGKTTLIRTVLGRVRLRTGRMEVAPGGIGLVPQEIALFPRLTVAENLAAFARLAGVGRSEAPGRVRDVAKRMGLDARQDDIVGTLSGGWQRRVNIAAAILHGPALLILDEPTAGVDVAARGAVQALVRELAADGMGIVLTTHDMVEAEAIGTHAALLSGGRIALAGPIGELLLDRFGGRDLLTLATPLPPGAAQARALEGLGFDLIDAPAALVADDHAGLALVAGARAAGITVTGFAIERPGLGRLYAVEATT